MNLQKIADQTFKLVEETADFIRDARENWRYNDLKYKDDQSLVTSIDVETEDRLVSGLGKILPEATFLAEEKHKTAPPTDLMWIIDPIDGTTNFVHNLPMYCMSIALWHKGKMVFGCIYEITSRECFWAHDEKEGAYVNNTQIYVSKVKTLKESLIATGFPSNAFNQLDEYLAHFRDFMINTQGLRRLGSAAMDLAYVASGRCEGFFEYNLNPWDVAAGAYFVQKAGGRVTDFSGGNNYLFGKEILAANAQIHDEFLRKFNIKK